MKKDNMTTPKKKKLVYILLEVVYIVTSVIALNNFCEDDFMMDAPCLPLGPN